MAFACNCIPNSATLLYLRESDGDTSFETLNHAMPIFLFVATYYTDTEIVRVECSEDTCEVIYTSLIGILNRIDNIA